MCCDFLFSVISVSHFFFYYYSLTLPVSVVFFFYFVTETLCNSFLYVFFFLFASLLFVFVFIIFPFKVFISQNISQLAPLSQKLEIKVLKCICIGLKYDKCF